MNKLAVARRDEHRMKTGAAHEAMKGFEPKRIYL
jgi:hypothetical protein